MSIFVKNGIPIPTPEFLPTSLAKALPKPQVEMQRSFQRQAAWCYAACAEMVIFEVKPSPFVDQCKAVRVVKNSNGCCKAKPDAICTGTGCSQTDIKKIFDEFDVNSTFVPGSLSPAEVATEINANPRRPVEVAVSWRMPAGQTSGHVLIVNGISGQYVHLIDPLQKPKFGDWRRFVELRNGFGHGKWSFSWINLKKKLAGPPPVAKRKP
jgi:hypothetical protein